jgi:hypothetical protein
VNRRRLLPVAARMENSRIAENGNTQLINE